MYAQSGSPGIEFQSWFQPRDSRRLCVSRIGSSECIECEWATTAIAGDGIPISETDEPTEHEPAGHVQSAATAAVRTGDAATAAEATAAVSAVPTDAAATATATDATTTTTGHVAAAAADVCPAAALWTATAL